MNAQDWFEDYEIVNMLEDLVKNIKDINTDESGLDVFLRGLKGIARTSDHFLEVVPMMVSAILNPEEDLSITGLIEKSFYAVTKNIGFDRHDLLKIEYMEDNNKVAVDFKAYLKQDE